MPLMEIKLAAPFFVHGLRDHAGTHTFFFDQLNRESCHILSFDLLGHGYSSGEWCTIDDYRNHVVVVWRSIIRALKEHIPQGIPVVIMGYSYRFSLVIHALNELITKNAAWERIMRKRVAVVIGLSPALKVGHTASALVQFFAPLLAFVSRHIKNIPLMSLNPEKSPTMKISSTLLRPIRKYSKEESICTPQETLMSQAEQHYDYSPRLSFLLC
jgi:alpha-beta hydrolase superfamily lysophospholipase